MENKNKTNTNKTSDLIFNHPDWIPKWVIQKVKDTINEYKPNVVYNIYGCGCVLPHYQDRKRKNRIKQILIRGSRTNILVCSCEKRKEFICKLKICSICHQIFLGKKERPGDCGLCRKTYMQKRRKKIWYFQNGVILESAPNNPSYTEPHCKYRSDCLDKIVPYLSDLIDVYLWCYKCQKYEDGRNI